MMLYLGLDHHRKQITVTMRDETGKIVGRRQVSTHPERIGEWLAEVQKLSLAHGGWVACVEVCGFGEWLWPLLTQYGCLRIVVIQPETRSKQKTDRRDSNHLSELLWVNRHRLLSGERIQGVRVVQLPSAADRDDRQVTVLRQRLGRRRTQIINRVCHIINKHHLHWECPTQGIDTKTARRWLHDLELAEMDRLELNHCLEDWERCECQIAECQQKIVARVQQSPAAQIARTVPGASDYAALTLTSRIGDVQRFATPRSLGNYWGLTPSCRDSGEKTGRRGSITKDGSPVARFILGQLVLHVLRRDSQMRDWYKRIKLRRGSKIARVAVMRRLTTILWHMLRNQTPYVIGGLPPRAARRGRNQATPPDSVGARGPHPACPTPPVGTCPTDSGGCRPSAAAKAKPRRRKTRV